MRRREFLALGSAAAAKASLASAQERSPRIIGILDPGTTYIFDAFEEGMRKLGYIDGQNIFYLRKSAGGRADLIPQLAAEIIARKVDVIVSGGPLPMRTLLKETSTIPIVFAALGDPIGVGAVNSLAKPGRNATGLSIMNSELSVKRLELLHDALPKLTHVAVFYDPKNDPHYVEATKESGLRLGLRLEFIPLPDATTFEPGFAAAADAGAQAADILASAFLLANRSRLVALAEKYRLPAIYEAGEYARDGGLIAYGPDLRDMGRRSAIYVQKILNGGKPGDLPVEQPTKFELVVNLKAAKAIGVTIPEPFLLLTNEIIE